MDKHVKNLTLTFSNDIARDLDNDKYQSCSKFIINVLKKNYFCNLVNLNILVKYWLEVHGDDYLRQNFFCKEFFEILLKNKELIKHQFEQFNIGYKIACDFRSDVFYAFSWNDTMTNDQILSHQYITRMTANYFAVSDHGQHPNKDFHDFYADKDKYRQMECQWECVGW